MHNYFILMPDSEPLPVTERAAELVRSDEEFAELVLQIAQARERRETIHKLLEADRAIVEILSSVFDDPGIQDILTQLHELDALADEIRNEPIATLELVHTKLAEVRLRLGERLARIFNQCEGMSWESYPITKSVASLIDEAATMLSLKFLCVDAQGQTHVGSLRATPPQTSSSPPNFRFQVYKNKRTTSVGRHETLPHLYMREKDRHKRRG